ncbi:MAG: hypothetical protein AAGF74_03940 [Pseudomonadota bacterium]
MTVAYTLFTLFPLDWIDITIIMMPIFGALDLAVPGLDQVRDPSVVLFAILVAATLQTSFLTPPIGVAGAYIPGRGALRTLATSGAIDPVSGPGADDLAAEGGPWELSGAK